MHRSRSRKSPRPITRVKAPGRLLPTRGPQVFDGTWPQAYGSYLDVDCHGGTFAEATGHRIGKAVAAEPSSLVARLPREFTMHNPRKKPPAPSLRTRLSAEQRRALDLLAA